MGERFANSAENKAVALNEPFSRFSYLLSPNALTAAALLVVNVCMLVFVWPGFFQADHQKTIMGILNNQPSEWHSLLWGYLALPFLYWTPSYGFYGFIQIALFVTAATFSISRLASLRVIGRGGRLALTMVYACTPTFLLYNMLWASDVVFAITLVPLTVMLIEIMVSKGECFKRSSFVLGLALLLFFAIELRKNALLILVCAIPLLWLRYKSARKTVLMIAGGVVTAMLACSVLFSAVCGAEKSPSQEVLSVPAQQIARTINEGRELPDSAAEILYSIRSEDEWSSLYTNYSADSEKEGLALTSEFVCAWLITGLENPGSYFRGYVELLGPFYTSCVEWGFDIGDSVGIDVGNYDSFSSSYFNDSVRQGYQDQFSGEKNNANAKGAVLVGFFRSGSVLAKVVEVLFFNRALPFWSLMLGGLAMLLFVRRGIPDYVIVALPALCVLTSLLLFSPVALFRYSVEIYYCLPIVATWVVYALRVRHCATRSSRGSREGLRASFE